MRHITKEHSAQLVGSSIEDYRDAVESAFDSSKLLQSMGVERPWITVECQEPNCPNNSSIISSAALHRHRVRLEIR